MGHRTDEMRALNRARSQLLELWSETDGQDLIEYSLLLAFLALATVALLGDVKSSVTTIYSKIGSALSSAATTAS